jgi:hypothetical protein
MKEKNPLQCLVWFRLNGLGSSQNGQISLIHNWCIGGCWFTEAVSMWSCTVKLDEEMENMPVWMRKMVLAHQNYTVCGDWWKVHQHSGPPQKEQINMIWLLLSVYDWSRWFAISSPPLVVLPVC